MADFYNRNRVALQKAAMLQSEAGEFVNCDDPLRGEEYLEKVKAKLKLAS
ncbi:MAG: hypothetical protein Q8O87_00350 [bacterium]|nr:hypothetical protein [bacterium]